ncbi:MAG TPA: YciI family protein [Pseudonocardiaceae bacterium]
MRYMILVKANADTEAGVNPGPEIFEAMGKLNEEMVNAGVLLAGEGLHPSREGARVVHKDGRNVVVDGPFAETKELIAGFWMLDVKSLDEAVEWANKVPGMQEGENLEIRRVFEIEDFPADAFPPEAAAREQELRDRIANR